MFLLLQMDEMEAYILEEVGSGGFATDDFEIVQQLGRIGILEVSQLWELPFREVKQHWLRRLQYTWVLEAACCV